MKEIITPFPIEFFIAETPKSLQAKSKSKQRWKETVGQAARQRNNEVCEWFFLDARPLAISIYYLPSEKMEGDIDNIVKPIMDALIGVAYLDDQVVEHVTVLKFEPDEDWTFDDPSEQLAGALDAQRPVVHISVKDDLSWRFPK